MKREKFSPTNNYRYVVPDPSNPKRQINEQIDGTRYALIYSYGYLSAYGVLGKDVAAAHAEVPALSMEFTRKIWDEGIKAGSLDRMGGVTPPNGLKEFLKT